IARYMGPVFAGLWGAPCRMVLSGEHLIDPWRSCWPDRILRGNIFFTASDRSLFFTSLPHLHDCFTGYFDRLLRPSDCSRSHSDVVVDFICWRQRQWKFWLHRAHRSSVAFNSVASWHCRVLLDDASRPP